MKHYKSADKELTDLYNIITFTQFVSKTADSSYCQKCINIQKQMCWFLGSM